MGPLELKWRSTSALPRKLLEEDVLYFAVWLAKSAFFGVCQTESPDPHSLVTLLPDLFLTDYLVITCLPTYLTCSYKFG